MLSSLTHFVLGLLFESFRLIVEQNKAFHLQLLHDGNWNVSSISDEPEPSNSWITQLLEIVDDAIPKTADQIVISASTNPLHGEYFLPSVIFISCL